MPDGTLIGRLSAEVMEELDGRFSDDAEIVDAALVVAVSDGDREIVRSACTGPGYVHVGLLSAARDVISYEAREDDDG